MGQTLLLGVTGTRDGLSGTQKAGARKAIADYIREQNSVLEVSAVILSHGDCVGADEWFHNTFLHLGDLDPSFKEIHVHIEVYPPEKEQFRAHMVGDVIHDTNDYLARNRNIVGVSQHLFATPIEFYQVPHGGTWYTIDYARKRGVPTTIIYPDGTILPSTEVYSKG